MLPFLLFIILNAVNFAYLFLMAVNITGASRSSRILLCNGKCNPSFDSYTESGSTHYSLPCDNCDDPG
jgi:hypothetical protein